MLHDKLPQLIYAAIAIVSGALAAWLAVTARVKSAIAASQHDKAALKAACAKLKEATLEIAQLRRQVAKLIGENEALSGRSNEKLAALDEDWEQGQSLLEQASNQLDSQNPAVSVPAARRIIADPDAGRLVFRRGPVEIDPETLEPVTEGAEQ